MWSALVEDMVAFNKYLEGAGLNPVWDFTFFKASFFQLAVLQHTCKDHNFVSFLSLQVQKKIIPFVFGNKLFLNDLLDALQKLYNV